MPILNDGQSPAAPRDERMRSASIDDSWPAELQESVSVPLFSQDDPTLTRADPAPAKPATDDGALMTGLEQSPAPSGAESEAKEKEPADTNTAFARPVSSQPADDSWTSESAIPGILPPPKRAEYTSSFLRPGSKFAGQQQSDKQVYNVEVTFKSVDIRNSSLCGYLRIEGLTKDHPTLTTYFEGEIIGTKYTFQTKHEKWGATERTDMQHWARFPAWRPLSTQAKRPDFHYKNYMEKENIFMRWKEYFLVPDHHVREIQGASFEGFYYICFNQVKGTVSGIYFHSKSEKYQQLGLEHVDDMSGFAAIEFR